MLFNLIKFGRKKKRRQSIDNNKVERRQDPPGDEREEEDDDDEEDEGEDMSAYKLDSEEVPYSSLDKHQFSA